MNTNLSLQSVLPSVPSDISNALGEEFIELKTRFARQDWGPAELNGGRFAEAALRFLEWKESGSAYTPIGQQLNRSKILGSIRKNTAFPEGLRFHVASCIEILMDIRNKRDVAHLGATVDVNEMDARLVHCKAGFEGLNCLASSASGLALIHHNLDYGVIVQCNRDYE